MSTSIFLASFLACQCVTGLMVGRSDEAMNSSSTTSQPDLHGKLLEDKIANAIVAEQQDRTEQTRDSEQKHGLTEGEPVLRDIFIVAGQSNALGLEDKALLPQKLQSMPSNVKLWSRFGGTTWLPWTDDTVRLLNVPGLFGPETSFAHSLAQRVYAPKNESFGVIKTAKINTNLWSDWSPGAWEQFLASDDLVAKEKAVAGQRSMPEGQQYDPSNDTILPPGILFATMVDNVRRALASDACHKSGCQVKALLWVQGEADSFSLAKGQEYKEHLDNFFSTLKAAIDMPDMQVIISQLGWDLAERWAGVESVIQAEEDFVQEQGRAHAALVRTDNCTKMSDGIHYDAAGLIKIGQLATSAYLSMREAEHITPVTGEIEQKAPEAPLPTVLLSSAPKNSRMAISRLVHGIFGWE